VGILWFMPIQPIGQKNRKGGLGSYYAVRDYMVGPAKFIPELLNVMRGPWTHPVIRTSV
jgi:hypothetical protein